MRYSKLIIAGLFFVIFHTADLCGQNQQLYQLDSLKAELRNNKITDTVRAELLLDIAFVYRNISVDSAKHYAQQSLSYSKSIDYLKGQVQAIRNIGLSYLREGNYDTAIVLANRAAITAKRNNLSTNLADAYNTLGIAHYRKSNYDSARFYYEESAKLFRNINGREADVAGAYLNIGSIYENQGNYIDALKNFQESLLVFEQQDHKMGIASASYNLANLFKKQGDIKKALQYMERTVAIDSLTGNKQGYAESLGQLAGLYLENSDTAEAIYKYKSSINLSNQVGSKCRAINQIRNLGEIYLLQERLDSAYQYLNKAVETAESCKTLGLIVSSYIQFSKYLIKTNQRNRAIEMLEKAHLIANKEGYKSQQEQASNLLYELYKKLGEREKALYYLEIADQLEDELFNAENTRKIAQLEAEYLIEKERQKFQHDQELRDITYNESLAEEKRRNLLFIIVAIALLLITLVLLRLYYIRTKYNKLLNKQNEEITLQNAQINEQIEEISHQSELLQNRANLLEEQSNQLNLANKDLKQINEEKNTIIGIVAHDLKSPINQIQGLLELMRLESDSEALPNQYLSKIEDSAKRSIEMIDRILDISAAENKEIKVKLQPIDLKSFTAKLVNGFDTKASKKAIQIDFEARQTVQIQTDPLLLTEIIENLLSNALKYSPMESKIRVVLDSTELHHQIHVSDEGPGISKEEQRNMFDSYTQLSAKPTADEKSTGLGLSIVKRYINVLNYDIECISDGNCGTTFIIKIPIQ